MVESIYLLCLAVSRLKEEREYRLLDQTLRE